MIMNKVKKMRNDNAKFLAQLKVDQLFYAEILKDYDEDGLRAALAQLKQEQQKEKERIDTKLKLEKRKGEQPTPKELELFATQQKEITAIEKTITDFSERVNGREKGLKTIGDIEKILAIMDGLTFSQRRELNNL